MMNVKRHCNLIFIRVIIISLSLLLLPGCLFKKKNNIEQKNSYIVSEQNNKNYLNKNQILNLNYIYIPFANYSFLEQENEDCLLITIVKKSNGNDLVDLVRDIIKSQGFIIIKDYKPFNKRNHIFYIKNPLKKIFITIENNKDDYSVTQVMV